jgi:hypothetical protein
MKPAGDLVRHSRVIILCIFVLFVGLAVGRCFTNLPWVDEGWFFDPIYNWLTHGHTGTTVIDATGFPWEGVERHQYWQPPFHLIADVVWVKITGFSLPAYRGLSVFAGIFLLLSWIFLLDHFQTPTGVKLLAFLFIATDYAVLRASSDGRTDMLAASLGLGAVATYLRLRERRFTLAIALSQILVVCGGLTHPMGGIPYLVMLLYFFVKEKDWRRIRPVHVALVVTPYIVGVACWGAYILQEPATFRKIFLGSSAAGRLSGMGHPLLSIRNEIVQRYLEPFGLRGDTWVLKAKVLVPIVYFLGAALVWIIGPVRRQTFLKPFLAMWSIMCLSLLALDNQRNGTYLGHVFPLYAILLASLIGWLYENRRFPRALLVLFAAGFFLLQAGGSLYIIYKDPYHRQYLAATDFVLEHAAPGDRIVGTSELGFGIGFDRLVDDMALGYYTGKRSPDILILSPRYAAWYERQRRDDPVLYAFVERRLSEFEPAYQTPAFTVLVSKARQPRL